MKDFLPTSELEIAMIKAKAGLLPFVDMLNIFLGARILLPSANNVDVDGSGFQPLEFSKKNVQMLSCFTNAERIADFFSMTPFYLDITGMQLLRRLPKDYGIVVNPGWQVGFDISPQGIEKILADFAPES